MKTDKKCRTTTIAIVMVVATAVSLLMAARALPAEVRPDPRLQQTAVRNVLYVLPNSRRTKRDICWELSLAHHQGNWPRNVKLIVRL